MRSDRFVNSAMAIIVTIACTEIGARVLYAQQDIISLPFVSDLIPANTSHIDPYEIQDPTRKRHWRLKPGYSERSQIIVEQKKNTGKLLGAKAFSGDGELKINSAGFRGPELSIKPVQNKILMIGDSVTFGLAHTSYPSEVSKLLSKKTSRIEVINAGVEGYRSKNHLYEIDRYKQLKPSVVTIMLGWNEIFSDTPVMSKLEVWWRTAWLYRFVDEKLNQFIDQFVDVQKQSPKARFSDLNPDRDDASIEIVVQNVNLKVPALIRLIDSLETIGSKIALITLPGLLAGGNEMNDLTYRKVHLPAFTKNPYVLLALTEKFNSILRKLALERGLILIDLAEWSKKALKPRQDYFYDSVHLTPHGLRRIAVFISEQLIQNRLIEPKR